MSTKSQFAGRAIFASLFALLCLAGGCARAPQLPDKNSREYREAISAFYVGLAGLQVGDDVRAESDLARLVALVPNEPAAWANYGLLALRQRSLDVAAERFEKARTLASDNSQLHFLIGLLESARGRLPEAVAALRKAIELDPRNLKAAYTLAEQLERQGDDASALEVQQLFQKILDAQPDNLAAQLELTRVAAKRGDTNTLRASVARLAARAAAWPPEVQQQWSALEAAASNDPRAAATRVAFLRNVLVRVPEYRRSLAQVKSAPGEEAEPFARPLKLAAPEFTPAAPDADLTFNAEGATSDDTEKWDMSVALTLDAESQPVVVNANSRGLRLPGGVMLPFPSASSQTAATTPDHVLALDFNYDFKTDLVLAGAGGVRLFRQDAPDKFTDVTAATSLPAAIANAPYAGVWAADIEADGDLDIVAGASAGEAVVLRNNGDGTFKELRPFTGAANLRRFVWADFDADGDPDAATLDAEGRLAVFTNERVGQFKPRSVPAVTTQAIALAAAETSGDEALDLLLLKSDGAILRLSDRDEGRDWTSAEIARVALKPDNELSSDNARLLVADVDNSGALDLIVSDSGSAQVLLGDVQNKFSPLKSTFAARVSSVADINGDGRLDLVGVKDSGQAARLVNHGAKNYHWQVVRPRAKRASGDQRINSFGVGGEMEIRSGLLVQKQLITSPSVHFGLGEQTATDVVRIVWPNGSVRAEFALKADQIIVAEQRLKGSCPFLFAFDGREMKFVKDGSPWGSAIGLRIETLGTAAIQATEEWFKIRGDQLAPREGFYDLRVTAELWETYYYDHLSLMVVDHPAGTEVFVDERFSVPPPALAIHTTDPPQPVKRATDDLGQDVTGTVRHEDGNYLDTFGRGDYQGITRDHYVEIELPEGDATVEASPASSAAVGLASAGGSEKGVDGKLWLVAHGWVHPTDSSINEAIGQGRKVHAEGLRIEVPDGRGGWETAKNNLGIPAGRLKTLLFDISNIFRPDTPRRLRLRTNLEIFWDKIEVATGLPRAQPKITRLDPSTAELGYRGFSVINQANASSPEVPDYKPLAGTTQRWRDLVGYYTRFGDVRELMAKVDDRYVLMNAGDELRFLFPAQAAPPQGWVRDYILIGDGWIKDGDYNSEFSKTVLPLPSHDRREYTSVAPRLEDDPVYRRFPEDWQRYHTRFVAPDNFRRALQSPQK
ncbi:MAG TPA: FG-GAP-like repeat-containing protein [Pyrinomonadaceae bacterium]|jgi:tetratricopeptide (TPR) repeat protein|nr:FG-GAP-like repeat-containing protein [Pyrinomonadaceae bacterium]